MRNNSWKRIPSSLRLRRRESDDSVLLNAVKGAVAGTIATWAMGRLTTLLYDRENRSARQREDRARHGRTSYESAAERTARAMHRRLTAMERKRYGNAIHWALGIGAGVAYGALSRWAAAHKARGLAFGTAVWLFMDETMTPLLRLTPGPRAFPWQTHARGLAGHLLYGAVADTAFRALRRIR